MTTAGLLRHLESTVRLRSPSLSRFAEDLGHGSNWLRRKLRGRRPLTVAELFDMLDALGVPPPEFFGGYLRSVGDPPSSAVDALAPQQLLRDLRSETVDDPTLTRLLERPPNPLPPDLPLVALPERLVVLEELRVAEPSQARFGALDWLHITHRRALRRRSADTVSHYASALGLWASVERDLGRLDVASAALEHALDLHTPSPHTVPHADLLLRTADVLRSRQRIQQAMHLLHLSGSIATLHGVTSLADRARLALGHLLVDIGQQRSALPVLRPLLTSPEPHCRGDAVLTSVEILRRTEQAEEALAVLRRVDEGGLPAAHRIRVRWHRAMLEAEIEDPTTAADDLVALLPEAAERLPAVEVLRLFLDTAQLHLDLDEVGPVAKAARLLLQGHLHRLESYPAVKELAIAVWLRAMRGQLERSTLKDVRRRLDLDDRPGSTG